MCLCACVPYLEPLVDVVHEGEQLDEVIHGDGDDGGAEGGGGQRDEAALPLQGEDGEQGPGAQQDAQGDPHRLGVVELLHDLEEGVRGPQEVSKGRRGSSGGRVAGGG